MDGAAVTQVSGYQEMNHRVYYKTFRGVPVSYALLLEGLAPFWRSQNFALVSVLVRVGWLVSVNLTHATVIYRKEAVYWLVGKGHFLD